MAIVQSVGGPLDTADLGFTLMHEHVVCRSWGLEANFPTVFDREAELTHAVALVRDVMSRGVKTMVDQTPADWRDVPFVQAVARATGLQVLVATGLYYSVPAYFRSRSAGHAAALFIRDIEEGIAGTGVRAAFIKCATHTVVDETVEKILVATAQAHRATGVPISTHTEVACQGGLTQQKIFAREGVDLTRVLIGHCGDSDDLDYLRRILDRGSLIGMDRFGLSRLLPTERRVATIARLCELGYADQMVLSHDYAAYIWIDRAVARRDSPDWHWNTISDVVLPALREVGVAEAHIEAMTVANPRRFFERQGGY